jgi:hypothetical protein
MKHSAGSGLNDARHAFSVVIVPTRSARHTTGKVPGEGTPASRGLPLLLSVAFGRLRSLAIECIGSLVRL